MTKLEFEEVLKATDIYNPVEATEEQHGSAEDIHWWNNMAIFFSHSDYTIVKGKIPLEVANTIYEKYPDNHYGIRIEGGCSDWKPADWTDGMYISYYHIDTKEGLLVFITETKDYFLRKQNLPETEVKEFDKLYATVNRELLKRVNPTISPYDWMQGSVKNKEKYNETVKRNEQTEVGKLFRTAISNFDKAVNPFLDETIEFDDIENYIKRVHIKGNVRTEYINGRKYRDNCGFLRITNRDTGEDTYYGRTPDSFSFELHRISNDKCYGLRHIYRTPTSKHDTNQSEGEMIVIATESLDEALKFNLSNGHVGDVKTRPATLEELVFIYNEIIKATRYAEEITKEKMQKMKEKNINE